MGNLNIREHILKDIVGAQRKLEYGLGIHDLEYLSLFWHHGFTVNAICIKCMLMYLGMKCHAF